MEMNMKYTIKLLGIVIVIASVVLVACSGGGTDPVKTEKVWKLVERSATTRSGNVSYKYNGSGLLEKQVFNSKHFEFIYNDQGVLLKKDKYNAAVGGELVRYEEFDKYGEATKRVAKVNGVFKTTIGYKNKYPSNLDINDQAVQKEIQKYTQRKILQTWTSNELNPYMGGKLSSREREFSSRRIETFSFNGNEMRTSVFQYPDDGVADGGSNIIFDEYGIRLFRNHTYDYTEGKNDNLELTTDKATGHQVHYTWKLMDIPVQ